MSSPIAAAFTFARHGDWARVVPAAKEALANEPDNAGVHALLALGLAHLDQGRAAVEAAQRAMALEPELAFAHYAHGWALLQFDDAKGAERAAREVLRLDPDADAHALLGQALVRQRRWEEALDVAQRGLAIDPEHGGCANLRVLSLANLGRQGEADAAAGSALALDPEDGLAHANRGWLLLRQSKPEEALDAFRTALRVDPSLEWARAGVVEALKARYIVYRVFLNYTLWVSTLTRRAQWLFILGLYFGFRFARGVLRQNPDLAPVLGPVLAVYTLFCITTWIAGPLSNLLLRFNTFGRLVLAEHETLASNLLAGCLGTAALAVLVFLVTGEAAWIIAGLAAAVMVLPIGGAFNGYGTRAWTPLLSGMCALGACAVGAMAMAFVSREVAGVLLGILLLGVFAFSWFANYLIIKYQ